MAKAGDPAPGAGDHEGLLVRSRLELAAAPAILFHYPAPDADHLDGA